MTDYLTTPGDEITLGEVQGMIIEMRDHIATADLNLKIAQDQADAANTALTEANAKIAALQGQTVAAAYPAAQMVQVLHARPEGNAKMNIVNVQNDGTMLTVYVN